jgi:hypothetical protein
MSSKSFHGRKKIRKSHHEVLVAMMARFLFTGNLIIFPYIVTH